jgi:hypothetical protein
MGKWRVVPDRLIGNIIMEGNRTIATSVNSDAQSIVDAHNATLEKELKGDAIQVLQKAMDANSQSIDELISILVNIVKYLRKEDAEAAGVDQETTSDTTVIDELVKKKMAELWEHRILELIGVKPTIMTGLMDYITTNAKPSILDMEWEIGKDGCIYDANGKFVLFDLDMVDKYRHQITALPDAYRALVKVKKAMEESGYIFP